MRKFLIVLAVYAFLFVVAPCVSGEIPMMKEDFFEEKFGKLPAHDTMITGIRFGDLIQQFLGPNYMQRNGEGQPEGVRYAYRLPGDKYPTITASVGIYENQDIANYWFVREYSRSSIRPGPRLGLGDRAFVSHGGALVLINNVFVSFSVLGTELQEAEREDMFESLLNFLIKELECGSTFVSRGKSVNMPVIEKVGLPDRAQLGRRVTGKLSISNIDVSKAIFGATDHIACINVKGDDVEITYYPTAGPQEFTIFVATPENVIVTKNVKIMVE